MQVEHDQVEAARQWFLTIFLKIEVIVRNNVIYVTFSHPFHTFDAAQCVDEIINVANSFENQNLFNLCARRVIP